MTETELMLDIIPTINHLPSCERKEPWLPMGEWRCFCYELAIYNAGLKRAIQVIEDGDRGLPRTWEDDILAIQKEIV